ncbi:uncharacterized protein LOC134690108 [Mytilus trossulus]|uniref:uncharacterized protein LOC134690108 n=1 Tax=Mytilus trossulus TaxID=6551 RepID=UPI003004B56C
MGKAVIELRVIAPNIFDNGGNIIGIDSCDSSFNPSTDDNIDYRLNYCPDMTYKTTIEDPMDGDIVEWSGTPVSDTIYAVEFTTTTNTEPDFVMSELNVRVEDHTAIDMFVMNFYFNDSDYSDRFLDIQPEYDSDDYFYLDTQTDSIHVKATLPHTVGTHEVEHTFVVWAEDSCYNRVTGTVTITTFNVPPDFPNMPESLYIDDIQTGGLYTFEYIDYSNGGDPISCDISSTEPATSNMFYLDGETITLHNSASLNKAVSDEYLIHLSCFDGTDYGISNVTFMIKRNITEDGLPEVYYYTNTTEWLELSLSCVEENEAYETYPGYSPPTDPYIVIDSLHYMFYNHECNHSDAHGVQDKCNNRTQCTFNVTNSNIQSSCGTGDSGIAGLYTIHHCIKDGGWTTWGEWGECDRTCSGGWRRRERNFTNPTPNYHSKREVYEDDIHYDMQRCNLQDCPYSGDTCRLFNFEPVCNSYDTKGYVTILHANYTYGCAWNYDTKDVWHDVTSIFQGYCNDHYDCVEMVSDDNIVPCSTDYAHESYHNFTDTYMCGETGWTECERTNTSVMNHRFLSYCGIVYWEYNCTIPQWAYWSEWTGCSVSCGRGQQTRQRLCDNEFDTKDGYRQRCNQPGSELHNSETRDCPLKGVHDFCPYCGVGTTYNTYSTLSNSYGSYQTETLEGNAYLLLSDIDEISCCGKISQWKIMAKNTGWIKFIVWRKTRHPGENHLYEVVGSVKEYVPSVGYKVFNQPLSSQITLIPGDFIGVYDYGNNIIGYDNCDSNYDPSTDDHIDWRKNLCPTDTFKMTTTEPVDGNLVEWNTTELTPIKDKVYAIRFVTTTNKNPTYTMPIYSVSIPDYTAIDEHVIDLYFTDNDYADFWQNAKGMLDNHDYFYYDSTKESIHVKTKLFHEVGQKYHYYKYTVWAEDSCYNKVTGTVTITTYNLPPVFNDLPGAVNISELQWGGQVYTFNLTDPDEDVITWEMTVSPSSTFFYMENMTIYLYGWADLDYDTVSQYVITITANDGTELTISTLTVDLIEHIVLYPTYYEYTSREGQEASISCMVEHEESYTYPDYIEPLKVYIIIDNVTYNYEPHYGCLHNLTYGVKDMCDNKTDCSFDVTNANVASQCGTEGEANLWIRYHCVRDAGWTTWNNWHDCTRTCGGGYRVRHRNCSNPTWNYFGSPKDCEDSIPEEWERCNTHTCEYAGRTCRNDYFSPECHIYHTNGSLDILLSNWTHGCAWDYNTDDYWFYKPEDTWHNGITHTDSLCHNHYDCDVLINDSLTWCRDYDVEFTYKEYYRCGWGWEDEACSRTKVSYYTNRYISFCGTMYWEYGCIIPQWSQWSHWSDCSITCDRGYQTRTRYCESDTESNTVDGYNNTCGQKSDEPHTLETRDCLLKGNHRYCTYCEARNFSYVDIGNLTLGPVNDTQEENAYIMESEVDIVRCCGLIASWTFYPVNVGTLKFIVWRSIGVPGYREVVGTNSVNISDTDLNKINTFIPPDEQRITIVARDFIGWFDGGAQILSYDWCNASYNASYPEHRDLRENLCPTDTYKIVTEDPQDGDVVNWNGTKEILYEQVFAIQYTTVENTLPYFNLSRYEKTIPDHSPIDFSLIDFFFNDTDYADWFVDYQPEYDNDQYFYFDTWSKSVHVKDDLLHIVGERNQYHLYVIWAEDSCYNRVTGTVTITTFNGPPTFPDFNKKIYIEETATGALYTFTVDDPSKGPDPITCNMTKTNPETENVFFLEGQTIHLSSSATLNADTFPEYEIYVSCSDGTDTTLGFLRVEISKDSTDNELPEEWVAVESYVLGSVTIASVTISTFTIFNIIMNGMPAFY